MDDLHQTAAALVRHGAGILAADESIATCGARLQQLGLDAGVESRRAWREVLLAAPGLAEAVSGVILFDETIRQRTARDVPFVEVLANAGVIAGIKVDVGTRPLAGAAAETITEGLDGLRGRLIDCRDLGARFAKWRAVITIDATTPSRNAVHANAHALARYAALCQQAGVVPIVEPEVLMKGSHDLSRCDEVTRDVLAEVFTELRIADVDLAGMVLKPSMVVAGTDGPPASAQDVATATVACLRATVPATVAGIAFLSGGQAPALATEHLLAINSIGPHPWPVTFSFGRAIQDDVLVTWAGRDENVDAARGVLMERVRANGAAARPPVAVPL